MNNTRIIIFTLLLVIVFGGIIYAQNVQQQSRERWEYMGVINRMINVTAAMQEFNEYGNEGWELVMVNGNTHIFKRRLP